METETYTLPAHWSCPLIYGDMSGLSDDDIDELERWLDDNSHGICSDVTGEPEFQHFHCADSHVLPCDCLEFTFIVYDDIPYNIHCEWNE